MTKIAVATEDWGCFVFPNVSGQANGIVPVTKPALPGQEITKTLNSSQFISIRTTFKKCCESYCFGSAVPPTVKIVVKGCRMFGMQ